MHCSFCCCVFILYFLHDLRQLVSYCNKIFQLELLDLSWFRKFLNERKISARRFLESILIILKIKNSSGYFLQILQIVLHYLMRVLHYLMSQCGVFPELNIDLSFMPLFSFYSSSHSFPIIFLMVMVQMVWQRGNVLAIILLT